MSTFPDQARAVVIGCGIVGNSRRVPPHRPGLDGRRAARQGPAAEPGRLDRARLELHLPVDHSKEMTQLTLESVRQYKEMDVFTECGGIEVARTEERMEELRRRMASAKAWGVEPVSLVTPAEVKELVPFIDESILLGGFYYARRRRRRLAARRARSCASGRSSRARSRCSPTPRSSGIDVESGRIAPRAHDAGNDRGRDGRDRLRRLEPDARARWPARTSRSRRPCTR